MNLINKAYFPLLDGVRAIAIILVIVYHWIIDENLRRTLPAGPIGVTIFFVLSGFLITRILLKQHEDSTKGGIRKYFTFFMRRVIRIFPIYYVLLIGLILLNFYQISIETDLYSRPIYYFTFFYNHLLESTKNWNDYLSPLWSIAVEEQFYVFWAGLILFLPKRFLNTYFFATFIVLGPLFRWWLLVKNGGIGVYMPTCIDCFAYGGLLAYLLQNNQEQLAKYLKLIRVFAPISLVLVFALSFLGFDEGVYYSIFFRTHVSIVSVALIYEAIAQNKYLVNKILSWQPLKYIGKISYSLYLFHMAIPLIILLVLNRLNFNMNLINEFKEPFALFFLLVASSISWILIEKPFMSLKRYFKY